MVDKKPSFLLNSPDGIEGIGAQRAATLSEAKIQTIAEMFRAGAPAVHALCSTASAREVGEWFCKAMLLRVKGISHDLADALVRSGIRSTKKLSEATLASLEAAIAAAQTRGGLRDVPDIHELSRLQQTAWKLDGFGMLAGRLRHKNGQPVRGALIDLGDQETRSDDSGWYAFDRVREGRVRLRIEVEDRPIPMERLIAIQSGKLTGPIDRKFSGAVTAPPMRVIRELDGELIANTRGTRVQLIDRPLSELREGTILQVRHIAENGETRLLSYHKELVGRTIYIPRTRVKIADLPDGAVEGAFVLYRGEKLEATALTQADVAASKREKWKSSAKRSQKLLIEARGE